MKATTRTLGDFQEGEEVVGTWILVIQKEAALPVRGIGSSDVELTDEADGHEDVDEVLLNAIETDAKLGNKIKGKMKSKGKWFT